MSKIMSYLKPYKISVSCAWVFMLIELVVELMLPLFMAKIIDEGVIQKDMDRIIFWGAVMLGLSFIGFAGGITNSFFSAHASQHFGFDVRAALFKKVQSFSFTNLAQFQTSSLITRLTNDITQVQNTVFMGLRIAMRAPLLVVGGAAMALVVNAKLALFLVIPIPLLVLLLLWMMKKSGSLFRAVQKKLDMVNSVIQENLAGMRLIRAYGRKKHQEKEFLQKNKELRDQTIHVFRFLEMTSPILLFIMNACILAIIWSGHAQLKSAHIQMGEIAALINYGFRITSALSILTFIMMAFSRGKASAERIAEVLDIEVDMLDSPNRLKKPPIKMGKVEFQNACFSYPDSHTQQLTNISFTAMPGETVAVMGATGAGKTSLFMLLPRLYDLTGGRILIDGADIRSYPLEELRNMIGFVPQDPTLFTGTVAENISWGKRDASFEEMIQSAKDAQIHETILQLPYSYDTKIGQKGVNLSGGQKQRLSIARALIRKPLILMLDDSTSALDMRTESKLLNALEKYRCTIFIITQKITAAIAADHILVLDEGRIEAFGTHDELLSNSSIYRKIYKSQFSGEVDQYV
ncbi:MAG TPA: ABC transporter ATP-binding protein [Bacillaceae bacterium]